MAYEKQEFTNGQILTAEQLNRMSEGISDLQDRLDSGGEGDELSEHLDDKENPHEVSCEQIGAVTEEKHDADTDYVLTMVDGVKTDVMDELNMQLETVYNDMYTKSEVDAAVAESKAVIVTVNGSTPSHTSQDIYTAIQAGKAVYLYLWGSTYLGIAACTESEARFEDSIIATISGADGESYSTQRYRMYYVKGSKYSTNSYEMASKAYVDAQIAYYLNQ